MQLLDGIRKDVSFALRSLRRAKGFTAAVVLTLALGIGANATIFAIINTVVLRPVSGVTRSNELFDLGDVMSYPGFRELRERLPSIGSPASGSAASHSATAPARSRRPARSCRAISLRSRARRRQWAAR
ncbi:MAG: hypothetical protein M3081_01980 [Gemmatimonadota bacterium]|nr:hypothetical protein [Gemmatimonadota bacterium]